MKKFYLTAVLILLFSFQIKANQIILDSKAEHLSVFLNKSGEITRVSENNFEKGEYEIFIKIPQEEYNKINKKSLQVKFLGKDYEIKSFNLAESTEGEKTGTNNLDGNQNKIKQIELEIAQLDSEMKILEQHKSLFKAYSDNFANGSFFENSSFNSNIFSNFSNGLMNSLEYISDQESIIFRKKHELEKTKENLKSEIVDVSGNNRSGEMYSFCRIQAFFYSSVYMKIQIQYALSSVSWKPYYEIKLEEDKDTADLLMYCYVEQNTAVDWNSISVTLKGRKSAIENTLPELESWYLEKTQSSKEFAISASYQEEEKLSDKKTTDHIRIKPPEVLFQNAVVGSFYTISEKLSLSSGKPKRIFIDSEEINVHYHYKILPQVSDMAFVFASLDRSEKTVFYTGRADIIKNGALIRSIDELSISKLNYFYIGKSNDFRVNYEIADVNKETFWSKFTKRKRKTHHYKIKIEHLSNEKKEVVISESLPVTDIGDEVNIEILDYSNKEAAELDKEKISWKLDFDSKNTFFVEYKYAVEYPFDLQLIE